MSMFFTRDAWDEDRDARIEKIGLAAYEAEQKLYQEKYDKEHSDYVSKSEPHVRRQDVIGVFEDGKLIKEAYITEILENGDIVCRNITTNPMQDPYQDGTYTWQGEYRKVCSTG
jgi:hypothetical protein